MAPEQCDHGVATPQTDLFGLGAALCEAVAAMEPFPRGDDRSEIRAERYPQLEIDAPPLTEAENVPSALSQIVMACLQRDPARRPRSAIDVAIALHGYSRDSRSKSFTPGQNNCACAHSSAHPPRGLMQSWSTDWCLCDRGLMRSWSTDRCPDRHGLMQSLRED